MRGAAFCFVLPLLREWFPEFVLFGKDWSRNGPRDVEQWVVPRDTASTFGLICACDFILHDCRVAKDTKAVCILSWDIEHRLLVGGQYNRYIGSERRRCRIVICGNVKDFSLRTTHQFILHMRSALEMQSPYDI